jgi:alpha-tubulin suppressor-like RCC1 family protein
MCDEASLLGLPLELITAVCQQLDPRALVRFAATCTRFRYGEDGLETAELPTKSPVVTTLREHAFPCPVLVPRTRPIGCSESWVAYLARCARQHRCLEAMLIAAGHRHNLYLDAARRLLACGEGAAVGHGDTDAIYSDPAPVAGMAGVRVRSVAAGFSHSLALSWDGRVYSWGINRYEQLGHGDKLPKPAPVLVEGLEGVCGIAADSMWSNHSLAVTESGAVFRCGCVHRVGEDDLRPIIVKGFGGVRVRRVFDGSKAFAIGEAGELFSWGFSATASRLNSPCPSASRRCGGVRVSSVSVEERHALALAEDGLVYA